MIAVRESHPPVASNAALRFCAAFAVAMHVVILFVWKLPPEESPASAIEGDTVEVALVESAAATAVVGEQQPPVASPEPPPEPASVPPPAPPKEKPEMTLPEPPKPTPPPRSTRTASISPKATPQPAGAKKNPTPRNPSATRTSGGASVPMGTSAGGIGSGKIARTSYITRPVASYPADSRAAGEHGVVVLRLVVDASGRPTYVTVRTSSGYPRLDRAALEAGWRCRVRDAAAGSHLDAPVRFDLTER